MATAYKVVKSDFGSETRRPGRRRLFYVPGDTVKAENPVGLFAYTTLALARRHSLERHRWEPTLIVELEYSDEDMIRIRTDNVVLLSRCRVVRVAADLKPSDK